YDQLEQGRFPGAIAPDEPDLVTGWNGTRCARQDRAPLDAVGEVVNVQHGGADNLRARCLSPVTSAELGAQGGRRRDWSEDERPERQRAEDHERRLGTAGPQQ